VVTGDPTRRSTIPIEIGIVSVPTYLTVCYAPRRDMRQQLAADASAATSSDRCAYPVGVRLERQPELLYPVAGVHNLVESGGGRRRGRPAPGPDVRASQPIEVRLRIGPERR